MALIGLALALGSTGPAVGEASLLEVRAPLGIHVDVSAPRTGIQPVDDLLGILNAPEASVGAGDLASAEVNPSGAAEENPLSGAVPANGDAGASGVAATPWFPAFAIPWFWIVFALAVLFTLVAAAWAFRGQRERRATRASAATAAVAAARAEDPTAQRFLEQGRDAVNGGELEKALVWFDCALRVAPDLSVAHLSRALALEGLGRYAEAHEAFGRAASCPGAEALCYYHYARSFVWMGLTIEAIPRLQLAIAKNPRLAARAREDPAFGPIQDHPLFHNLVGDRGEGGAGA